jgi:hypothetical protein
VSGPPSPPPRTRPRLGGWLRLVQTLAVVAISYFIVAYLVHSWDRVHDYPWRLRWLPLAFSLLAFLAFYVMNAVAWWLLLRGFGLRGSRTLAAATWGKSILARYLPGNVFMFVGRAWMSHTQGLDVKRVSAAMVYEQALGVGSALVTVAVLFPFWHYEGLWATWSLLAVPLLVALMHPRVFGRLSARVLRLLGREPLAEVMRFRAVLALLCYYVAAWLVAGLASWLLVAAVTGSGAGVLPAVVVAFAFAYVVGMAAFVFPSGIGVREAVLAAALASRLPGGVALAWAVLLRLWQTVIELLFVGLAVMVDQRRRRRDEAE